MRAANRPEGTRVGVGIAMLALGATLSAPVYAIDFELTSDITGNVITNSPRFQPAAAPSGLGLIASPGRLAS